MKFNIGDKVWFAHTVTQAVLTVCPDCAGNKQLKVILGDGSEVAIDCACCDRGWVGSRGTIEYSQHAEVAKESVVTGISLQSGKVLYTGEGFWEHNEEDVFGTESEAIERAKTMVAERTAEEVRRSLHKEKDGKTWAFHVTYHRRAAEHARKDLDHHTAKLTYAKSKAKEAK